MNKNNLGYDDIALMPIFKNIKGSTIIRILDKCFIKNLSKGEILFWEKDKVNYVYLVFKGKVTIYKNSEVGQRRVIYILNDGEFINEIIVDDIPASINCEAFEDSKILAILKDDLLNIMEEDFNLTKVILNSMSKKIRRLYRQIKNTVPIKMDKKLAAKLWKLSKDYGVEKEDGIIIDLNISITYLADMLGSSRETISRCMSNFEKQGLIRFQGKKIVVNSREALSIYFRGM